MSDQYFYVRFNFSSKIGLHRAISKQHEAVVEVPKDLVRRKRSGFKNENLREKGIALDFARTVALALFSSGAERVVWPYNEDALWFEDRHPVMNVRPCDHEENGIRAWKIF